MDAPSTTAMIPTRIGRAGRDDVPNLRGEDETEMTYLMGLIECTFLHPLPFTQHILTHLPPSPSLDPPPVLAAHLRHRTLPVTRLTE